MKIPIDNENEFDEKDNFYQQVIGALFASILFIVSLPIFLAIGRFLLQSAHLIMGLVFKML